jgi:NOL1/NOP2/sun family putative RNA methylase
VKETRLRLERRGFSIEPEDPVSMVFRARNLEQPGHLPEYALGHIHAQALSSVLAGLALEPQPGDVVLDLCASPGGKTTLLAQLMGNRGIIVANDRSTSRHVALNANLKRLGVTNTVTAHYSGEDFPRCIGFDRILVDVPCSAEGMIRVTTEGRIQPPAQPQARLSVVQKRLLLRAFDLLKPGGILLYSTCTYNPVENEDVVQSLLEKRPAAIQPIDLELPHSPGLNQWEGMVYESALQQCWRIYPHKLDTVGFFLARVARAC